MSYLLPSNAAQQIGITHSALCRAMEVGNIPYWTVDRKRVIPASWIETNRSQRANRVTLLEVAQKFHYSRNHVYFWRKAHSFSTLSRVYGMGKALTITRAEAEDFGRWLQVAHAGERYQGLCQ